MKKTIFTLVSLFWLSANMYAQDAWFEWARSFGSSSDDIGYSIAHDPTGNVYMTGNFQGTVDFDPGPAEFFLTSNGGKDIFISKFDASGNFIWARSFGVNGTYTDEGRSITVDADGNACTTGTFEGTIDFDPGSEVYNLTSNGYNDVFILKLNGQGNFIWAKNLGGDSEYGDYGYAIALDAEGNVYTTGMFGITADFDPGSSVYNLVSNGFYDVFISKLDPSGNFIWAKNLGGTSNDIGNSIIIDAVGNVYTTGYFQGTADFDPGSGVFNLVSKGSADVFISKLDPSGNFIWAKSFGAGNSDIGKSIALDANGNVYTTGEFRSTVDFDPGSGVYNIVSKGGTDIFVSKLDASGNFIWAKNMGGTSNDFGNSIIIDAAGNVYTTGWFYGTADFDPGSGTFNLTSNGLTDAFISKLDVSGNFIMAKNFGGNTTGGNSLIVDASKNIYSAGYFTGTADFNPGPGVSNLTSNGGYDIFISKLSQPPVITAALTAITEITASGGGYILDDGGTPVSARGVCWSTDANPTTSNHHTTDGSGFGTFTSSITGLTASFTYYVRAYATNGLGTIYGNEVSFTTPDRVGDSINIIRGGPAATIPLAVPVQITGVSANPYNSNLTQWTGVYQAPQSVYDQGTYVNDPDNWSNIEGSATTGSRWVNSNPGIGYGILVVDLLQVRSIENISVFGGNSTLTHIALAGHTETGSTPPGAFDAGWAEFLTKSSVGPVTNNGTYISDPTKFSVNGSTRYVKIMAYNDGSYGGTSYIELKGIKMYIGAYEAQVMLDELTIGASTEHCFGATQTITTNDFTVQNGGSATLGAGENILLQASTLVEIGGYLHAWIDPAGNYCDQSKSILAGNKEISSGAAQFQSVPGEELSFKVFPNPTDGTFTVEFNKTAAETPGTIEIWSMMGERLTRVELKGDHSYTFDLTDEPSGIYLVRAVQNDKARMQKVIKFL